MFKFLYRLVINLAILAVLLPLEVIGWVVLLPVCYKQGLTTVVLPRWLRWYDNADIFVGRNTDTYKAVCKTGWFNRYTWLAFRNPLNYLGYVHLGVKVTTPIKGVILEVGDEGIGDGSRPGFHQVEILVDNKVVYEYYYIHRWSKTKCLRFRMGHKIGKVSSNKVGSWIQWVMVLQPYKSYWGV